MKNFHTLLPSFRIVRRQKSANAKLASRNTDHDQPIYNEWGSSHRVTIGGVCDLRLPHHFSGVCIEGNQISVQTCPRTAHYREQPDPCSLYRSTPEGRRADFGYISKSLFQISHPGQRHWRGAQW